MKQQMHTNAKVCVLRSAHSVRFVAIKGSEPSRAQSERHAGGDNRERLKRRSSPAQSDLAFVSPG